MDTGEIIAEMARHSVTKTRAAAELHMSYSAFSKRMNGKVEFKLSEISRLCEILGLDRDKRDAIFFGDEVS